MSRRSPGERIIEILNRFKEDEVSRAEALNDILRVLRSTCENCKHRTESKKLEYKRQEILKDIQDGF
ncbi:hypothetical protein Sgly_0757 [Syntrophobotulus glycolicus DSM 8271]|uniref:Uncharacterized protein n=1 Tax=Syntrophobotulus glycolicus (strain DSM 8271 / FlGlyR) TaxID=645991 RepID=F0T0P9_SYNGF|nr:hypothetical protein [Syntrophobotulus glycolicus]ADY55114.1 hypothetical protein Sgly_0757 [Syntrophobotulus glycolicus DSM 8271]